MRALVALGAIAVLVAACGSTPPPTSSPSSAPPVASPSAPAPSSPTSAEPSSAATTTYTVKLPPSGGQKLRVVVHDPGSVLAGARVPTAGETADLDNTPAQSTTAVVQGRTGKMLVVSWFGTACDKKTDVTVAGTQVQIAPPPAASCESDAIRRTVTLKFKAPVKADDMQATLVSTPAQ